MSDRTTLDAARQGDLDAWRDLYRTHAARLLLWLESRSDVDLDTRDRTAAATWLTAAEKLHTFSGTDDDFTTWLLQIARAQVPKRAEAPGERARRVPKSESVFSPSDEWVRDALAALAAREREVIACRDVLGVNAARAAQILDMNRLTIAVIRRQGLKTLRAARTPQRTTPAPASAMRVQPRLAAAP